MAVGKTSKNSALKHTPKKPKTTTPKEKKPTLEQMASDENTGISRALAEAGDDSNEFLETLVALGLSPMYERVCADLKLPKGFDSFGLDLLATRMYLAGRFDQRGAPVTK